MPDQDDIVKKTDSGLFRRGIYATEDIFYASYYTNSGKFLDFNQKAHVICCLAVYNDSKIVEIHDLSLFAQEIRDAIELQNKHGYKFKLDKVEHFFLLKRPLLF